MFFEQERLKLHAEVFQSVGKTPDRVEPIDYSKLTTIDDYAEAIRSCVDGIKFYRSELDGREVKHTGSAVDSINGQIDVFLALSQQ